MTSLYFIIMQQVDVKTIDILKKLLETSVCQYVKNRPKNNETLISIEISKPTRPILNLLYKFCPNLKHLTMGHENQPYLRKNDALYTLRLDFKIESLNISL